ncbi:conserved hypothetical protein [Flavobacteria bacterium BBFL7]|nr:conserved hypothetical protein [Flavobacteria bacterium BBFL7]
MRKLTFSLILLIVLLCSHDLYIKMDTYFFSPNSPATLSLYNGTFEKSENIITRDRMLDASIVGNGDRVAISSDQWKDQDSTITQLTFNTGQSGTYVAGVSTAPRSIELTAQKFNSYLEHDGVTDMLETRKKKELMDQPATEKYEKHVKAIFQVGDEKSTDWNQVLGYPIEFIPMENPYHKNTGDDLQVKLLLNGQPLTNQLVFAHHNNNPAGHSHKETTQNHSHNGTTHSHDNNEVHQQDHSHTHGEKTTSHQHAINEEQPHTHTDGQQLRTDDHGMVTVKLPEDGLYYIRTIYMVESEEEGFTHHSRWATLTFETTHKHDASTHTHNHDHEEESGIPTWVFILGSILVVGILFLVFQKKS